MWINFTLYDFGLRSLISVIELAGILYKGEKQGVKEVIEAIKILVLPRLSQHHRQILLDLTSFIFEEKTIDKTASGYEAEAARLKHILEVRIGIILLGDIFSGKTTTMKIFENQHTDFKV